MGRPVRRDRLALILGAALLAVALLAALTGRVLAIDTPKLADSSPTADHIERPVPAASSPEPPAPRSLFLDLPDPPPADTLSEASSQDTAPRSSTSDAGSAKNGGEVVRPRDGAPVARRPAGVAADVLVGKTEKRSARPAARSEPSVKPGSGSAKDLLADPNCRFSEVARGDLEAGIVDEYLISALQAVCREHSIYVNVFKTGHTFGAGLAEGPEIPVGYGNAGGYPNTHYFGRAADIWEVDGKPVEGNGADPDVVSVGRMLAGLPARNKPDVVIGPDAWNRALGYGPDEGWVLDGDQVALHDDHLHVGYWHGDGTPPPQIFLSPTQMQQTPYPTGGNEVQPPAVQDSDSDVDGARVRKTTKFKETIEPAESLPPKPRPARHAEERKDREKPGPQRSIVRRIQRSDSQKTAPQKTELEATPEPPREPRDRKPEPNTRPLANRDHSQKPGEASAGEDQYTNIKESQAQDEVVTEETTSSGAMVTENTGTTE